MKKKHGKFPYLAEKQYLCSPKINITHINTIIKDDKS